MPFFAFAQSQDQNYIKTTTYKQANQNSVSNPDISVANIQVSYYNGLGFPIQQINHKQSNTGKDLIIHIEYDGFGRQVKDFLPFVNQTASLDFDLNAAINQANFYSNNISQNFETTNFAFSEKQLENSPLSRILRQAAPGESWKKDSGHEIQFEYDLNSISDEVKNFVALMNNSNGSTLYTHSLDCIGYYDKGKLYKKIVKNENWTSGANNTTEEYIDSNGKIVLKRAFNNNQKHDTYYVFDKIGNLIFVIPPLASDLLSNVSASQRPVTFFQQRFNISTFLVDQYNNPVISGGGGMSLIINNNTIMLELNAGLGVPSTFDLSQRFEINAYSPIPDMTLGYIDMNFVGNHQFIAKIQDNKLFFEDYTPNEVTFFFNTLPTTVQNLTQSVSINLGTETIYNTTNDFSFVDSVCYQYKYDSRNRLVEKKLPGKQWEFIVYDKLDRPVATGPAFSPYGDGSSGWMITQYDVFGRVTQTGWINASVTDTSRSEAQTAINNGSTPFELSENQVLTKSYYDNYTFTGAPNPLPAPVENQQLALNVKGLQTGSWVRVLDNASSSTAELSYTLYDYKYRPVHTKTTNHLGGYTQVDTHLDWAGKTMYTLTKHKRTADDTELVVKDMFEYTQQDRLALHKQQINDLPEQLITKNSYDELGQLISKNVGGTDSTGATGLQTVDYAYNIRGWLKSINDVQSIGSDLFAFKINYNEAETATPLFNGNIAETFWKSNTDNIKRKYNYKYDDLNRLLQADYSKEGNTIFNSYLEHLSYDKNGNIQTLLRNGDMDTDGMQFENPIDNLTYLYDDTNKNQLLRVFDATASPIGFKDDTNGVDINQEIYETPDYGYDANGNMTRDDNKGITNIIYNHLNLPIIIYFAGDNKITYLYNATGEKLSKTVLQTGAITTTDYLSGFQYKNTILQFFPQAEGYVNATQNGTSYTFNYVFNYTDHLGNIRLSYSQDPSTNVLKVIEENHYYPFGLKHTGYNSDQLMYVKEASVLRIKPKPPLFKTSYNYKYNGKELQDELGLNVYDYGARNYDPALGRWMNIDPLAENSRRWTPYNYAYNNPIYYIDPDGMQAIDNDDIIFNNKSGTEVARIITPGEDIKINVGDVTAPPSPIIIDPSKIADKLGQALDVVGVSIDYAGVMGGGNVGGLDFNYFLTGEDKGKIFGYTKIGGGVGFDGEVGVSATGSVYNKEADPSQMNGAGMAGPSYGLSAGIGVSASISWSNEANVPELYPGQRSQTTWKSFSIGGGIGVEIGAKWFSTNSTIMNNGKPLNK